MNLHRLDLVSLSLFALVVRSGSISKGAALAHLALGAASKRIADLETAIGTELFERHSRGIKLTAAGEALERHAQRILNDVDLMAADLSDYAAGVVGVVRLWANTSATTQFLPSDIAAFTAANPGIRIELEEQNSDQVALAVVDGHADFGIMADQMPTLGLQTTLYRRDHLVLVVPAGHPLARRKSVPFDDALEFDFVSLTHSTSLAKRLQSATSGASGRLKLRIQVRSFDAMCRMVAAGLGIAVLPDAAVRPHLRSMGLRKIRLSEAWACRELLICARDLNALPKPARLLVNHLLHATPDTADGVASTDNAGTTGIAAATD
ncbi:LysR substrate-binding domain-containing protein [Cupriavidus pinatubonensis]|uniref:HTH-type transcriptional regulator CysB n=1 Tax=Cupriavidus pinatubonensis TaxID=248026 RepID=A0ABM8Y4E7_9BURK|nr:LysR substrate-binding domain-containing protein [Cupriavidus pinatubonensis]CAG9187630.1 HTH-type transcriptional regulator CysB [Cupriavidus pinatubonensis]